VPSGGVLTTPDQSVELCTVCIASRQLPRSRIGSNGTPEGSSKDAHVAGALLVADV